MLSLDVITFGVPDVRAAHTFYTSALSAITAEQDERMQLDMHGTGQVALCAAEALASVVGAASGTSGFRGYIMSYIVNQPSEVEAVLDAAVRGGATVLKPAKKSLFAGFSGVVQAPDGAIWKVAAATRKNSGPAGDPPVPTETAALLGVADPKASRDFYTALGMTVHRDYGNKYIDFVPASGTARFGLMQRKTLAKDVGVNEDGAGFRAVIFNGTVGSRDEVNALLAAAVIAGGRVVVPAGEIEGGGYCGHFSDPDGFLWRVTSA